jgi:hypothetical protein
VTGSCDDRLLAAMRKTLTVGHGPNPFGTSRGRRVKQTARRQDAPSQRRTR